MRVNRPSEPQGAATARAPSEKSASVAAPLFRSVIEQLAEDRRWVVLDLGAIRQVTLDLLTGYRVRLDIADIAQDIEHFTTPAGAESPAGSQIVLPAIRDAEPADIVLCWDLLNYLDRPSLAKLMAQVAARCRAGALVHALIIYSERVMHREPGQIGPIDAGTLLNRARTEPDRAAPRYSPEDLALAMPDYSVDRVRLLGNGMQEYLFKTRALRDALTPVSTLGAGGTPTVRGGRQSATRGGSKVVR